MSDKPTVERPRVLVAYASMYGQTEKIARHLAERLKSRGTDVTVRPCADIGPDVRLDEYDAALVGGPVIREALHADARRFVADRSSELGRVPSAFFLVSGAAGSSDESERNAARGIMDGFLDEAGWAPTARASFAGAIPYTRYPLFLRWIMKWISWRNGGSTDTSRDHEYTDWGRVTAFADQFAAGLSSGEATRSSAAG
jgi:menaquinone-dependent protoporphyrinogen oxidase